MPTRAMQILTAVLLLIGLVRMALVVIHRPLLGYANNWDFIKISSTLGVWPNEPGVEPMAGHPAAPLSHYRTHGERFKELRYLSSELIFVSAAILASDALSFLHLIPRHTLNLRAVGAVKMLFLFLVGALLTVLFFQRSPALGLLSGIVFAAVICDPLNTLYFNTLYFDDSAVMFGYLATGLALFLLDARQATALCVLLSAVITSTFLASLLGDGYADLCRHVHVAQSALMIAPIPAALVLGRSIVGRRRIRRTPFWRAGEEVAP